jgi:glycine/D-amino acid oxidase-like deaminating enzyme
MPTSTVPTWGETLSKKKFSTLQGPINTEIAIIGGGLAGILTAYLLLQDGHTVAVLESQPTIGKGMTMYTTAFLTKSLDTDFADMISIYGARKAALAVEAHQSAIETIAAIVKKEKIDCEFTWISNITYANTPDDFSGLQKEADALEQLGIPATLKRTSRSGFKNAGSLELKRQAKFHPTKFLSALVDRVTAMGGTIYTNAEVNSIKETDTGVVIMTSEKMKVTAEQAIVCTYQPIKSLSTFAKKGQYQSYVFELAIPKGLIAEATYEDTMNPYHYMRIDAGSGPMDRMIVGGEDHRVEIKMDPERNFAALEEYVQSILQGVKYQIKRKWFGLILEPSDGLPLIGRSTQRQLVATGFSGNGMTYSMIAATVFRDIIGKRKNPWIKIYDPTRTPTLKQLAFKGYDYGQELIEGAGKNIFHSKDTKK